MKRLLFYITAILVMAVFTALLQQGRQRNKFTELKKNYVENKDSLSNQPGIREGSK